MSKNKRTRVTLAAVVIALFICLILAGCTTTAIQSGSKVNAKERWIILPVQNLSQTPQAGERVEAILATLLRADGISNLNIYPSSLKSDELPELDERRRFEHFLKWAQKQNYIYAVAGSVEEWRYKSGIEGEPAVGVTLQVIDVTTGNVLWSATGARAGWGRETLSGTTQKLLKELIAALQIT